MDHLRSDPPGADDAASATDPVDAQEGATADEAQRGLTRRKFLVGAGAASGVALAGVYGWRTRKGSPSKHTETAADAGSTTAGGGPFVLLTLYGGNDGLNTVIPSADPAYRSLRPSLGYPGSQLLPLTDGLALNPELKGLHGLWTGGQLAIVRGVGYPNPNLSHFASTAIWQSGDPTGAQHTGWLGRWLDATGTDPMRAIGIGNGLPLALRGEKQSGTAIVGSQIDLPGGAALSRAFAAMQAAGPDRTGLAAALAESGTDLLAVQRQLDQVHVAAPGTATSNPGDPTATKQGSNSGDTSNSLDAQLDLVATLINAGAPTHLYSVSLGSFDTHAEEKANHERLLGQLDSAVTSFLQRIATSTAGRRTVLLTVSEFGRRPAENASGGTDHGTAAPLFVVGHEVKGGKFYGDQPSLTKLDPSGNQLFTVDFRSVYATVLERVVGSDPKPILGGSFPVLDFV